MNRINVFNDLQTTFLSVVAALVPLVLLFVIFQSLMLKLPRKKVMNIIKGTLMASVGLLLFLQGVHISFLPFGRVIGEALGTLPCGWFLTPIGVLLGFLTSWGEPSVRILANQVEQASSGSIHRSTVIFAICTGVALFVGLGMLRISYDIPLLHILIPGYALVIALIWFSDNEFLSVAIDAGGVATGPIANTFLLALAFGIATSRGNQDPIVTGLGLVALVALAPIISVMALGFLLTLKKQKRNENGNNRKTD